MAETHIETSVKIVDALFKLDATQLEAFSMLLTMNREVTIAHVNGRIDQLIDAFNALAAFVSTKNNPPYSETSLIEIVSELQRLNENIAQLQRGQAFLAGALTKQEADTRQIRSGLSQLTQLIKATQNNQHIGANQQIESQLATVVESIKSVRNVQKPDTSKAATSRF